MSEGTAEKLLAENAALHEWVKSLLVVSAFYAQCFVAVKKSMNKYGYALHVEEPLAEKQAAVHNRESAARAAVEAFRKERQA